MDRARCRDFGTVADPGAIAALAVIRADTIGDEVDIHVAEALRPCVAELAKAAVSVEPAAPPRMADPPRGSQRSGQRRVFGKPCAFMFIFSPFTTPGGVRSDGFVFFVRLIHRPYCA